MVLIKKPFYFIRHGQTDWNAQGIIMGQADITLNQEGMKQALRVKTVVETLPITKVFYSPLQRAAKTAELICQNLIIPKISSEVLQEIHLGKWSGMEKHKLSFTSLIGINPPDGESWDQFIGRVCKGINDILMQEREESLLLVSHGGVYDALCHFLEIENKKISNCQLAYFDPFSSNGWNVAIISE